MLNSISPIYVNKVPFKGEIQQQKSQEKTTEEQSNKSWMLWTGLVGLGALGIYLATRGKKGTETVEKASKSGQDIAASASEAVKDNTAKILEKLPSRKEVLESLGVKLNDEKLLTVMKKGADGKEVEQLYTGTHSYTARKGVNIKEYVENGIVRSRTMSTQKNIDNPIIKNYEYYSGQNLRGITTFKDNISTFTLKNQRALKDLRASLKYTPKTESEIKALNERGIKYEIVEETTNFGQHGDRKNLKEIYTYPENYPIKTKEVYYGDRMCTSNDGKEITLTFREPQQTYKPHYKADGYKLDIRNHGFLSELLGGHNLDKFENLYDTSVIPFNSKAEAYKEIMDVLNEEYSTDALRLIRCGK